MITQIIFIAQLIGLWLLNQMGYWIVTQLQVPVPGNVMGMLILFTLLATKIIRVEWVLEASTFLVKHLAFFFIPIAVGLIDYGGLFIQHGVPLLLSLVGSALVGFWTTGYTAQAYSKRQEGSTP